MYKDKFNKIEKTILFVKQTFIDILEQEINLLKVSGFLLLDKKIRLNHHLNNDGESITFKYHKNECEIIHSLAKWKRQEIRKEMKKIGITLK